MWGSAAGPDSIGGLGGMFSGIGGLDLLNAGSKVLSSALSPSPGGPSNATSRNEQSFNSVFDSSGWNVNFGRDGIINSDRTQETETPASAITKTAMNWIPLAALAVGGLLLWKHFSKK